MKSPLRLAFWSWVFATIGFIAFTGTAHAVQPTVMTVPWVASNPLIPHDTWSGKSIRLKGTADVQAANFQYTWDFGDGSPVATGTVTNRYAIEASHAYTCATPGTIFTASLTVADTGTGETDSENYFVACQAQTLDVEVNVAIDEGLWRLHKTMNRVNVGPGTQAGGHWESGCSNNCSGFWVITPANVTAFLVNGHLETGAAGNPYTETVQRAMRWVFNRLSAFAIGNQTYPAPIGTVNPDSNGNGLGIQTTNTDPPYQGGMFIDAIVATGTPAAVTTTGPTNVIGRTYLDIVQDMADAYVFGQGTSGTYFGGWRYSWNYASGTQSDNSTNQWAAIGLLGARAFGATVPQFVIDANINSVNRTQVLSGTLAGQFGYTNSTSPVWGPYATTPSGMVQMVLDGIGRGDARWDRSENFMRDRFCNTGGSTTAIRSYYYGMFSFTKAMRLHDSNGDGVPEPIQFLSNQPGGANPFDWYHAQTPGDPCDGVARTLVNSQNGAGYWYAHNFDGRQFPFETAWAIIMLNQTVFASGVPVAVAAANPNPAVAGQTITLDGSASFHQDAARTIVQWEWDLDNDGTFDATGVTTTTSFPALGNYPVTLRVTDDAATPATDDTTVIVRVEIPPLAPTADPDGPYVFCPQAQPWFLDGTASVNPDEGQSEIGQPGDTIQSYEWELNGDGLFDDEAGPTPDVTAFYTALGVGDYLAQLRVTDTTATSFPSSGFGDLNDTGATQVSVKDAADPACACIDDLTARPKRGLVQLNWTDTGANHYNVYRSTTMGGPYSFIASTTSTFSVYVDTSVVNETTYYYVVRPAAINGDEQCQSNEASGTPTALRRRR